MVLYEAMFPVISIGTFSISTFGFFLVVGFLFGLLSVWRVARAWDMNEEKILDLTLLTFLGGFLGARLLFIFTNFNFFGLFLSKWLFLNKYPGFSFFGGILGGFLILRFFAKRFKINFWQALDFAGVGLLGGLIFENIGCFFGGCNLGIVSKLFFAVPMVGTIGNRIPVQALEAILLFFIFRRIWKKVSHFHVQGTVAAVSLICISLVKLFLTPLRQSYSDFIFYLILGIAGTLIFYYVSNNYKLTKRKLLSDIKALGINLVAFSQNPKLRKNLIVYLKKSWYNYKVDLSWKIRFLSKILRRLNVRFSHKDSKYY